MPIKAKYNGSYKDITDLMNVDESIDYVLAKTSSSYKRVYTATRSIEDAPPTTFKSIKPGANLTDYRIYGNTSKNILPLSKTPKTETIGDILCEYDGKGTFTFTSNVDNPTYTQDQWFWVPFEEDFDFPVGISDGGHGCIQLNNDFATEYGVTPYFVGFANRDNGEFVSGFNVAGTALNIVDTNYYTEDLEGLPANCIAFQYLQQIGKRTVTIKPALYLDIRTQQPFEPYGESVGDRTGNTLPMSTTPISTNIDDFHCEYDGMGTITLTATKDNANFSSFTIPLKEDFIIPISVGQGGNGCLQFNNDKVYANDNTAVFSLCFNFNNTQIDGWSLLAVNRITYSYIGMGGRTINNISIEKEGQSVLHLSKGDKLTIQPAFYNNGTTEQAPFEPYGYKVPVTVEGKNLYKISTFRDGSTSAVVSAVTFTINNNAVSISGISSAQHPSVTSQRFELISGETYSAKIFVDGSYDGEMYIIMRGGERQDGSDEVKYKRINVGSGDTFVAKTYNSIIYVAEGTNKEFNAIVRVILIKGSMLPDTYEPYHTPITTPIYLPEPIKMVGDEAEYIDYGEQKFVKKFYKITLNFDDMNNDETFPGWSNVTAVVEYCNKIRSLAIDNPDSYKPLQYSSINEFRANFNVRGNRSILYLGTSFVIGHTQSELKEIYAGQSITFILKIPDTDLDVTLPALPTVTGTNVLSVGTEVQPSKIDITGHIKTISGGS